MYLVEDYGFGADFCNHFRAAKRRLFEINNTRGAKKKQKVLEIIKLARSTLDYTSEALEKLQDWQYRGEDVSGYMALKSKLEATLPHAKVILDVAIRRNCNDEDVAAEEKIVSLFDPESDIISKGSREVVFGHKVTLTTGGSGLITDIQVPQGNPADKTLVEEVFQKHLDFYGCAPESMTFDGCYFSKANKQHLVDNGVKAAVFSKWKNSGGCYS